MGYGIRAGDIISTTNEKAGALTLSQPLIDYRPAAGLDPHELWSTQPAVRTVVGFIARSISSIPFSVYQGDPDGGPGGGKVLEPANPVHRALHRPWPKQGQGRFIEALILDLHLFGRWGFFALPDGSGGYELPKIKANRFSLVVDGLGRYTGVAIHPADGGAPEVIPTDDVVFDLGPEPVHGDHRVGSTSVATLQDLARELDALGDYRSELFQNSAMVPAVIERPAGAKWSDDAWQRFRETFATYKAGGGNAGGTPILEDGMTYKSISAISPRDAQYIDVRKLALEEAAEAMHIPPELVGAREGTNSNILALREQLYIDVLGPLIKWTEEAMNAGLSHLLKPGEEIRADVDTRLRTDAATRAKISQTQVGRPIQTVNEARAERGWPAIDGGDELITPLNVVEGGLASPADTGQTNEPDPDSGLTDAEAEAGVVGAAGKAAAPTGGKADTPDTGAPINPAMIHAPGDPKGIRDAVAALARDLDPVIEQIAAGLGQRLGIDQEDQHDEDEEGEGSKGVKRLPRKRPQSRLTTQSTLPLPEALSAAFRAQDEKAVLQVLQNHLGKVSAESSLQTLVDLGADEGIWDADRQSGWLSEAGQTYAHLIVQNGLYERLLEEVDPDRRRAIINGARPMVQKQVAGITTEVISFGAQDAAKAAGATHKTWNTTSRNPRESHRALNGMTIPVRAVFPNQLRWPGDWYGMGPETANCQCRLTYSIQEL